MRPPPGVPRRGPHSLVWRSRHGKSGASGGRDADRALDQFRNPFWAVHLDCPLGDRGEERDQVPLFERGRVAQTILVALLVAVANDHFLDQWRHTHQPPDEPNTSTDIFEIPAERLDRSPLTGRNRPPPDP
ncbi:hypothetical protein ACTWPT_58365 [Nonomuraea sp. 3N208]|uniref:hypothetical protein n=1 Tax=Nonomuraea sp. 3N208 TaxID=3457421 RepID=UPI003FD0A368